MNRSLALRLGLIAALAATAAGCRSDDSSATVETAPDGQPAPQAPPREMPPPPPPAGMTAPRAEAEPAQPKSGPAAAAPALAALFPHVRAAPNAKIVEFDASAAAQPHDPSTPVVYLELLACTPDTREHESLVVTSATPSHIHAAMLVAGFTPGTPAKWNFENDRLVPVPPTGDPVHIQFRWIDSAGEARSATPADWVVNASDGRPIGDSAHEPWVFSGSAMVQRQGREHYDADMSGTVIGLATFGGEMIAWSRVFSPDSQIDAPEWIVNTSAFPKFGTPVVVRITPAAG